MDAQHAIEQGIAAAQANNQRTAYYYFYAATQADPMDEQAWLWRASAAPEPRDALFCLAAVLAINPDNPVARHGLEQISAAVTTESAPAAQTITPSLSSGTFKPPERRLDWQPAFQRELYDMARVPRMQPLRDVTEPPGAGADTMAARIAYQRPPPGPRRRVGAALRRILVDRQTQRVRFAVPIIIAVVVIIGGVAFSGLRDVGRLPLVAATALPAGAVPTLPSSGRAGTPSAARTVGSSPTQPPTQAVAVVATRTKSAPAVAPTAAPLPPTATPLPPTAVAVLPTEPPLIVPTLPPIGPTAPPVAATAAPGTPTPVPPTAAAGGGPQTAVLGDGQSLQALAQAQGVSLGALLAYNSIRNIRDVDANATLKIPPADYKPGEVRYTIRSGDNLTNIARLFGTSIEAIATRNGISNPSAIAAGQPLVIPLP